MEDVVPLPCESLYQSLTVVHVWFGRSTAESHM